LSVTIFSTPDSGKALENVAKNKTRQPENNPRETGLSFSNGGGGVDLTQSSLHLLACPVSY
jgi:hypothetical protein